MYYDRAGEIPCLKFIWSESSGWPLQIRCVRASGKVIWYKFWLIAKTVFEWVQLGRRSQHRRRMTSADFYWSWEDILWWDWQDGFISSVVYTVCSTAKIKVKPTLGKNLTVPFEEKYSQILNSKDKWSFFKLRSLIGTLWKFWKHPARLQQPEI